jgi:hypothetical protein
MKLPQPVRTRGGLLVGLVMMGAIGFELRTVIGMLFGVDVPAAPYFVGMVAILSIVGVYLDVARSTEPKSPT